MKDLKLDENNDVYFNGRSFEWIEGPDQVAQSIKLHLWTIQGEWAYNITIGIPWIEKIFQTDISQSQKEAILRNAIATHKYVNTVDELKFEVNYKLRSAWLEFRVTTYDGVTLFGKALI